MRVLHVGNVANNGYLNAKLQRRVGIEADAICDERHILSLPEWEDADLRGSFEPYPDAGAIGRAAGWERPAWVLEEDDPVRRRRFRGQHFLEGLLRAHVGPLLRPRARSRLRREYGPLRRALPGDLRYRDLGRGLLDLHRFSLHWPDPPALFARYDVVQAYATHPILAYLAGARPYVAFEHGTLRELPFEDTYRGRLLSLAYRAAAKVVITNPDVRAAAERLALTDYVFIPHPVDETKYAPGPTPFRAEHGLGQELLLLSPSSQTWSIKANDVLLRGFASFLAGEAPATLVLTEWGPDVERSRGLAGKLGVAEHVRWLPPLPKPRLIEAYRAADVVLDQFLLGTFGAVAPEAMACARPVVMAFEPELHRWCFPELPPIVAAREPGEVADALARLAASRDERGRVGGDSRRWIERHHGWRLVVDRQRAVYEEVVERARAGRGAPAGRG
ncbi:MAG: glycosyltransferase [Thermoleophilia bacterium]|nr:glycosyltransferase [Thermoleophilia bacterium]